MKDEKEHISFFVMPSSALRSLRDELQISAGEEGSKETLERYGYRCGEGLVQEIDIECEHSNELKTMMDSLLYETGLGRPVAIEVLNDEIIISLEDTVEALAKSKGECSFTKGYLSGIVSTLRNKKYDCIEEECITKGDERCVYRLAQTEEYIYPSKEKEKDTERIYHLEKGCTFLIKEELPEKGYEIFVDYVTHGSPGLCVTRDYPEKISKKYALEKTPIIWLSTVDTKNAMPPQNLSALFYHIETFLKKANEVVVILSGLEYLIANSSFLSVLKFIQLLNEQAAINNSIIILPVSPLTLDEKQLKMIEREVKVFEG